MAATDLQAGRACCPLLIRGFAEMLAMSGCR